MPARSKPAALAGLAVIAASLLGLALSLPTMIDRLAEREGIAQRPVFWFGPPLEERAAAFQGTPVNITTNREPTPEALDALNLDDTTPLQSGYIEVRFGAAAAHFPISPQDDPRLPGMLAHQRWFRVMPLAEAKVNARSELMRQIQRGEVVPRLVAVARYPAEGYDPESWGLVRRKEWPFLFAEFSAGPDARPGTETVNISSATYGELEAIYAPGPYDDPPDLSEEEKAAGMWRHDAMIQVTPAQLIRAKDKIVDEGLEAMGWTWPVAGVSAMGLVVGTMLLASAAVTRPPDDDTRPQR